MTPKALKRTIDEMTTPEQNLLRRGAAETAEEQMHKFGPTANIPPKWMSPHNKKMVEILFGDEAGLAKWIEQVKAERQVFKSYNKMHGNSTSAEQALDVMGALDPIRNMKRLANKAAGMTPPRAEALGTALQQPQFPPNFNPLMQQAVNRATKSNPLAGRVFGQGVHPLLEVDVP